MQYTENYFVTYRRHDDGTEHVEKYEDIADARQVMDAMYRSKNYSYGCLERHSVLTLGTFSCSKR